MTDSLTAYEGILLAAAAATAAAMNAVAGGGTFWLFPALMAVGLDAKNANATNCFILWIGSLTSAGAYWKNRPAAPKVVAWLASVTLVGALAGAGLLLWIPERDFRTAVPWLLLFATLTFAFGPSLGRQARLEGLLHHRGTSLIALLTAQTIVSIYGGFFGAGIGIWMLAVFGVAGMTNIHEMNALKSMLATLINGAAALAFVIAGAVAWPHGWFALAAAAGGYWASRWALQVNPTVVRSLALSLAMGVTTYYFVAT